LKSQEGYAWKERTQNDAILWRRDTAIRKMHNVRIVKSQGIKKPSEALRTKGERGERRREGEGGGESHAS
jgi:hypothetical protein